MHWGFVKGESSDFYHDVFFLCWNMEWNKVIRSKAYNLRSLVTVTVCELGKPSIHTSIGQNLAKFYQYQREVTYKDSIWNCYIGFRVEERLKSECRLVIDLIESNDLIREEADLDIVVVVIKTKLASPGSKLLVIAIKETKQYREIDGDILFRSEMIAKSIKNLLSC